jgi:hypothetical protein
MSFQVKSVVWLDIFASDRGRISARIRARRDPPKKLVSLKGEAGRNFKNQEKEEKGTVLFFTSTGYLATSSGGRKFSSTQSS